MNKQTLALRAAEYEVKVIMEQGSKSCLIGECADLDINHVTIHTIRWTDVLIILRELESEEEQ